MYESPITITEQICNEIVKQKEERIFQAIAKVGVDVNKEELIKALQYDRNQYNKGFEDGFEKGVKTFAERLKKHKCSYDLPDYHSFDAVDIEDIDNLLKELIGE